MAELYEVGEEKVEDIKEELKDDVNEIESKDELSGLFDDVTDNVDNNQIFSDVDNNEVTENKIFEDFGLEKDRFTILYFAGGRFGLGRKNTYKLFEELCKYYDNAQIIDQAGEAAHDQQARHRNTYGSKGHKSIKVLEFTDKVPELMYISDIVISKPGGLTTSESLASGLPMLIINPIPGQEEQNAEFLESNKLGYWIKKHDNALGVIFKVTTNQDL